jgi:hypothetical protein
VGLKGETGGETTMIARPDFPYRKLPGVRHGILTSASLWLGSDHILHVKNTRFAEEYRRYYLNDIQAIYLEKRARFLPPPAAVITLILGLIALLILSIMRHPLAVSIGWICLLAVSMFAAWLCIFRSCVCSIQTALGTDRLSCLHRVDGAYAALDQITNQLLEVQGPAQPFRQETPAEIPLPLEPAVPRQSKEQIFGWLALPFVLISSAIVMTLPVPIPDRSFGFALAAMSATVVLAVLALIAGRGGARFRALQAAQLALILISGVEVYALVLINTYSQAVLIPRNNGAEVLAMFISAAHLASIWLGGANVAVAFVTAALLLRTPRRGNPA